MKETPKMYAQRETRRFGGREIVVTRQVTPTPDQPAIEAARR